MTTSPSAGDLPWLRASWERTETTNRSIMWSNGGFGPCFRDIEVKRRALMAKSASGYYGAFRGGLSE